MTCYRWAGMVAVCGAFHVETFVHETFRPLDSVVVAHDWILRRWCNWSPTKLQHYCPRSATSRRLKATRSIQTASFPRSACWWWDGETVWCSSRDRTKAACADPRHERHKSEDYRKFPNLFCRVYWHQAVIWWKYLPTVRAPGAGFVRWGLWWSATRFDPWRSPPSMRSHWRWRSALLVQLARLLSKKKTFGKMNFNGRRKEKSMNHEWCSPESSDRASWEDSTPRAVWWQQLSPCSRLVCFSCAPFHRLDFL